MTTTDRGFERRDRLSGVTLHEQGAAENMEGARVAWIRFEHIAGEALCIDWAAVIQREDSPLKHVIAAA
ncbi:MAG TPA: hypothetical protein VMJ52_15660 [Xanthobacteraceae bacterium]|nr:hypothetical protein [Xanthobacteraceae bacterium]